jgi:hypothetical protein
MVTLGGDKVGRHVFHVEHMNDQAIKRPKANAEGYAHRGFRARPTQVDDEQTVVMRSARKRQRLRP